LVNETSLYYNAGQKNIKTVYLPKTKPGRNRNLSVAENSSTCKKRNCLQRKL